MTNLTTVLDSPPVRALADAFDHIPLYLVGGSVRDSLKGNEPDDLDFTTSAIPSQIAELVGGFGPMWDVGARYGTIGVVVEGRKVEITTFRADTYDGTTRKPEVTFGDRIEDDLLRRDFTMNAMAADIGTYDLIDPFDGATDLREGRLVTPADPDRTVRDDPLRALRAIRFAAKHNMWITAALQAAIRANRGALDIVSQERKTAELLKIAGGGTVALKKAVSWSEHLGITDHLFGSLVVDHPDLIHHIDLDPIAAIAAVTLGTDKSDAVNAALAMRLPTTDAIRIGRINNLAKKLGTITEQEARRLVRNLADDVVDPALAIFRARFNLDSPTFAAALDTRGIWRAPLPVNGDDFVDLGMSGPAVGRALRAVEDAYLMLGSIGWDEALKMGTEAA